jgi:hypothetical protein
MLGLQHVGVSVRARVCVCACVHACFFGQGGRGAATHRLCAECHGGCAFGEKLADAEAWVHFRFRHTYVGQHPDCASLCGGQRCWVGRGKMGSPECPGGLLTLPPARPPNHTLMHSLSLCPLCLSQSCTCSGTDDDGCGTAYQGSKVAGVTPTAGFKYYAVVYSYQETPPAYTFSLTVSGALHPSPPPPRPPPPPNR